MAINTLEYAGILQNKLDQHVIKSATSGWMENNAGQVKYTGGKEIKIPTIATQGLAEYDRDSGFNQGAVTLSWKTYEMTQDRGRTFHLDRMDVDETAFMASAANVMKDFQDKHVIPEIDAYRYSAIAAKAIEKSRTETKTYASASGVISALRANIREITEFTNEPLVITLTGDTLALIEEDPMLAKSIGVTNFKAGSIDLKVKVIDDIPLIVVPKARFKTKFQFLDGKTLGQEAGGFKPASDAKDINWLITARTLPIAVSKTDKIRIFEPDTNQKADAWKLDYRKYHELWIFDNQVTRMFASIKG